MSKAVINECYGGFFLTKEIVEYMIERGLDEKYYEKYEDYDENKRESCFNRKYYTKDIPRHHPLLIEAVSELKDKVDIDIETTTIAIKEFDGDLYRIEDYDGYETLITPNAEYEWINVNNY